MLAIEDAQPSDRFLMLAWRLSQSTWHDECAGVRAWLATMPSTISAENADEMLRTIDAPLESTSFPMVTVYCYADVPAGTKYDVAFDLDDPDSNEQTFAEVLFGVFWGRVVTKTLEDGCHQTAVLRFPHGLPRLFDDLPFDDVSSTRLSLCTQTDFPEIQRRLRDPSPNNAQPQGSASPNRLEAGGPDQKLID